MITDYRSSVKSIRYVTHDFILYSSIRFQLSDDKLVVWERRKDDGGAHQSV